MGVGWGSALSLNPRLTKEKTLFALSSLQPTLESLLAPLHAHYRCPLYLNLSTDGGHFYPESRRLLTSGHTQRTFPLVTHSQVCP